MRTVSTRDWTLKHFEMNAIEVDLTNTLLVSESTPVAEVGRLLACSLVQAVWVKRDNTLVGSITRADLESCVCVLGRDAFRLTARNLMNGHLVTIDCHPTGSEVTDKVILMRRLKLSEAIVTSCGTPIGTVSIDQLIGCDLLHPGTLTPVPGQSTE